MTAAPPATEISRPVDGRMRTSATISVLLLASAQIAMPLTDRPAFLSWVVIVALTASTCTFAAFTWPIRQVLLVALGAFGAGMLIEAVGVRFGVPFGEYSYTRELQPQMAGVPMLVGLAWLAMLLPSWDIARRITGRRWLQAVSCGAALTVWDLFLDPQMIGNGFWFFENPSGWNGVPFSNTVGWFVTGTLLSCIPAFVLDRRTTNNGLAFLYAWMIGFSALGYVIPFALDDPQIGVVGALCAAPLLYLAFYRRPRPWLA